MELDRDFARRVGIGLTALSPFLVIAYILVSFVAVVVFAVFLYYAVRPIFRFLARTGLPRRVRAALSLVLFGVPFLVLLAYLLTARESRFTAGVNRVTQLHNLPSIADRISHVNPHH